VPLLIRPGPGHQAAHELAVDLHQLAQLLQIVIGSVLDPLRLDGEDLWQVLALCHAADRLAISGDPATEKVAYLCIPRAHRLRNGLTLFVNAAGRIRSYLRQGCRKVGHHFCLIRFSNVIHYRPHCYG
jgi:hypothetical protein